MLIFEKTIDFVNFCFDHLKYKFDFEFDSNNHYGLIVLKKDKRIVGRFELCDKIYLDQCILSLWK